MLTDEGGINEGGLNEGDLKKVLDLDNHYPMYTTVNNQLTSKLKTQLTNKTINLLYLPTTNQINHKIWENCVFQ